MGHPGYQLKTHSLIVTQEILLLIADIDEFKGTWKSLQTLAPERLASLRHVATIESIGSSTRIEGARLTDRDVEALLSRLETHSFRSRDEEEVAGYADAMRLVFESWDAIPLTENHARQLHGVLLGHSGRDVRHRGEYKTLPNHVEAFDDQGRSLGIVFATASPFDTPARMTHLIAWTRDAIVERQIHPLLIIGIFTVVFLAIHPFRDGNGRLSRVLTTLLLLKSGYTHVPFSSLESVIEQSKDGYYLALRRTQGTLDDAEPDWTPWLRFFLTALQRQKNGLAEKIAREHSMAAALTRLATQILALVQSHGRVTAAEAERITNAPRGTIKKRLKELVVSGRLIQEGKAKATWYRFP
ncbi:MAG: Fic family protein [Acetobacteraceae bacterium]|nr:Fic family protein [Acetobacteraceae bacterium]